MTISPPLEIELKLLLPSDQVEPFVRRMARRKGEPTKTELVTRYFDTPEFELAARGVALRVRRAGRRWVQTLKTEGERHGGLSRRVEFEVPTASGKLDWARFPETARGHVPDALREQVMPVFETRFVRTAWLVKGRGGAEIEVALDVGEVRAGDAAEPIREIELELKAGQPDALFALALDWAAAFGCVPFDTSKAERGVRLATGKAAGPVKAVPVALRSDMAVEDGFEAIVQACLAQFQANLPGVLAQGGALPGALMKPPSDRLSPQAGKSSLIPRAGEGGQRARGADPLPNPLPQAGEGAKMVPLLVEDEIEYVHQARVALRRLRAALRRYRKVCAWPDDLAGGLKTLVAALGPARDWDVLVHETLPAIAPHCDDADGWRRGIDVLAARRAAVRAEMRAALADAQPGAWLLAVQRWLLQRGWRGTDAAHIRRQQAPLGAWAKRALRRGHLKLARDAGGFTKASPEARHRLRIAIKRERYAAEFFEPLFPGRRRARCVAALRAAQDALGRANDARVARGLLAEVRAELGPMGDFASGWLAAQQAQPAGKDARRALRKLIKWTPCW